MMAQVNAGRVRFVGRGEYNNSTQYYVFDLVNYNGNSYYAKVDTIGHLPTDTTYWQLVAEKGNVGPTGLTGNGISTVEKTSTSGLVDTYTITYTNGNTTTFDVSNGNGIDRIEKTATVGNKDTYTIYFTNGSTTTYEVVNGEVTREELEEEVERLSMIYNAFPSTTGKVEEGSINGTAEVPFKEIGLKGNTYQESTTGKNLWGGFSSNVTRTNGDISFSNNADGTISASGTATANAQSMTYTQAVDNNHYITLSAGTYTLSGAKTSQKSLDIRKIDNTQIGNDGGSGFTFTLEQETSVYVRANISNGTVFSGTEVFNVQIEKSSSKSSYEPYTGGNPAPNPSYPYPVNVVTGDNEVKVEGKNLINLTSVSDGAGTYNIKHPTITNGVINVQGKNDTTIAQETSYKNGYVEIFNTTQWKANTTYYVSYKLDIVSNPRNVNQFLTYLYGQLSGYATYNSTTGRYECSITTYSTPPTADNKKYIEIRVASCELNISEVMVSTSSDTTYVPYTSQTYPINLGSMELCKIGDYQDVIKRSSGKNLIDLNKHTNTLASNTTILSPNSFQCENTGTWQGRVILSFLNLKANTEYTFSMKSTSVQSILSFVRGIKNGTSTALITSMYVPYLPSTFNTSDYDEIQIDMYARGNGGSNGTITVYDIELFEGSYTKTTIPAFEPYGKVWCKYGAIGKLVLTGSEAGWYISGTGTANWFYYLINTNAYPIVNTSVVGTSYCNYYTPANVGTSTTDEGILLLKTSGIVRIRYGTEDTLANYKTWLSTHNTTLYYVLATPTITPITDTTLIEQLDNLEKAYSYDTQTNISQTNQDKPFIISYEAILSLRNVLNS